MVGGRKQPRRKIYRQARRDGNMMGEESSQEGILQASKKGEIEKLSRKVSSLARRKNRGKQREIGRSRASNLLASGRSFTLFCKSADASDRPCRKKQVPSKLLIALLIV